MHLLIGPSNAGKSRWIELNRPKQVAFAFQYKEGGTPPLAATLHYNLLLTAPARVRRGAPVARLDLLDEPLLRRCFETGAIETATVMVAPVADLLKRAGGRAMIEVDLPEAGRYDQDIWVSVLNAVDLGALYDQLFQILDRYDVPYRVLFNPQDGEGAMSEIGRDQVGDALTRAAPLCGSAQSV